MVRPRYALAAALLLAGGACVHGPGAVAAGSRPAPADSAVLNVTNDHGEEVVIYARGVSQDYRVGTVDPESDAHFVVRRPWLFSEEVEFVAETQGATRAVFRSGRLSLAPGDEVKWEIRGP
jgi:hypothetical protein